MTRRRRSPILRRPRAEIISSWRFAKAQFPLRFGHKNYEQQLHLLVGGWMLASISRLVHTAGLVLIAIAQIIVVWV